MTDPAGDVHFTPLLVNVAVPEIDILSAWVDIGDATVTFGWHVRDLSHQVSEDEALSFALTFHGADYEFAAASATRVAGEWWFTFDADRHDGSQVLLGASGAVDVAASTIEFSAPRSIVSDDLHDVKASSILALRVGNQYEAGGPAWFRDQAPDAGDGPTILVE